MTTRDPVLSFSQFQLPKLAGVVQQGPLKAGDALARLNGRGAGHRPHNHRTGECCWDAVLTTVVAWRRHACSLPLVCARDQLQGSTEAAGPRSRLEESLMNMHVVHTLHHAL